MDISQAVRDHWKSEKIRITAIFAQELAQKTKRTTQEILDNGLLANDFKGSVKLDYEDESYMLFRGAFALKNKTMLVYSQNTMDIIYFLKKNLNMFGLRMNNSAHGNHQF